MRHWIRRLTLSRLWHKPGRFFVVLGSDIYDADYGVTVGWGFRRYAGEFETSWRQVWRVRVRWPISIRHRHNITVPR